MTSITIKTPTGPLEFTIRHRSRVTKRLHMELDERGGLVIVAPGHWSKRFIRSTVAQNSTRIAGFMDKARAQHRSPLRYVCGEEHFYLGDKYRLQVVVKTGKNSNDGISGDILQVNASATTAVAIKAALQNWYRQQAVGFFEERLQYLSQRGPWTKGRSIPLKLRRMKRTWGNCSSSGLIKLNTHLIKAPLQLIDSVIAHELCHLEQMNHSRSFYALLEDLNPAWRQDRKLLRSTGFIYLQD
jgi:predicted metal-dependent hydrolase